MTKKNYERFITKKKVIEMTTITRSILRIKKRKMQLCRVFTFYIVTSFIIIQRIIKLRYSFRGKVQKKKKKET